LKITQKQEPILGVGT